MALREAQPLVPMGIYARETDVMFTLVEFFVEVENVSVIACPEGADVDKEEEKEGKERMSKEEKGEEEEDEKPDGSTEENPSFLIFEFLKYIIHLFCDFQI
jgi:hypothetical protein